MRSKIINFIKAHGYLRIIAWMFYNIIPGMIIYCKIIKKYGKNIKIYIEHYPGTGDVYLTCGFLESLVKREGYKDNYVLTVIGVGGVKMAQLFGIEKIEKLTQHQSNALIHFARLNGFSKLNIEVLHYHPMAMHNGIMDNLMSYNEINFLQMYLYCVFPGQRLGDFQYPTIDDAKIYVDNIFEINGLSGKKVILLCPSANTIDPLSWNFWCVLAEILEENGYKVCTNAADKEPVIPGTTRIFLQYKYMIEFTNRCDFCIGLRSGLFDFIAMTKSKLIVLYPKTNSFKFGVGSLYDYFSLNKMGLTENATEIEFYRDDELNVLKQIIRKYINIKTNINKIHEMYNYNWR